jgi:hypothetical protein
MPNYLAKLKFMPMKKIRFIKKWINLSENVKDKPDDLEILKLYESLTKEKLR